MSDLIKVASRKDSNGLTVAEREIILLNVSLDGIRSKMVKVKKAIARRKYVIQHRQKMIERGKLNSKEYTRRSEAKAAEAIANVENLKMKKLHLMTEMENNAKEILDIKVNMSKGRELIERSKIYKDLLDSLSPADWHETVQSENQTLDTDSKSVQHKEKKTLYFTDTEQMTDLISTMAERSVYLIRCIRNTRKASEDIEISSVEILGRIKEESAEMTQQFNESKASLEAKRKRRSTLCKTIKLHQRLKLEDQDAARAAVNRRLSLFRYRKATSVTEFDKISHIEYILSSLIQEAENVPQETFDTLKQLRVVERRNRLHSERLRLEWEKHLEKMKKCVKKTMGEPPVIIGKKLLPKCFPFEQEIVVVEEEEPPKPPDEIVWDELKSVKVEDTFIVAPQTNVSSTPEGKAEQAKQKTDGEKAPRSACSHGHRTAKSEQVKLKTQKKPDRLFPNEKLKNQEMGEGKLHLKYSLAAKTPRLLQREREERFVTMRTAEQASWRWKPLHEHVKYANHIAAEKLRLQGHQAQTSLPPISEAAKTTTAEKKKKTVRFSDVVQTFSSSSLDGEKPMASYSKLKQEACNNVELRFEKSRSIDQQKSCPPRRLPPIKSAGKHRSRHK
ncbi:uncharacterized protein LOC113160740 [Anabas testudineus]|uniref:uncharacterized protein LOC113160740 n=1 Tax=Anabas testudineus TaxID=64144 RepID=UPI000E45CB99|nr:uncharacterized protein LOC113160740 [Anabas testudineus]